MLPGRWAWLGRHRSDFDSDAILQRPPERHRPVDVALTCGISLRASRIIDGVSVSVFVLPAIAEYTEGRRLSLNGILGTKLHAVLDRGRRRDFFDLYVVMQQERLGIADCLNAIRVVYPQPVNDSLLLRSLVYFEDADEEAPLPGEGPTDWSTVKSYFERPVGDLLVPPGRALTIHANVVAVRDL